ncbi:PepSY domain-containing protein [uncultured Pseudomonas sp.]|uniref:PepSY-associated TM helix domain-containing protein n=1 Tax=uncultured Pseudomonas sp. TaxID=114707 RepID=UPI0025FFA033|nr:PepSY domain-containing protein [uncultured Pseudomonas sp.]
MTSYSSAPASKPGPLLQLLARLHFLIGLFVGPFLLVAAASGLIYALTPQLEAHLYAEALHTPSRGESLPLADQVRAAQAVAGPTAVVAAVRPAPEAGDTTRVMFNDPSLGESTHRALFIDPVTGAIRGDMAVYGTSGILPLRTTIDQFHRSLLLGEFGRLYSELAASWLWVAALGGLTLWLVRRRQRRPARGLRGLHASTGLWLLAGLLFLSATGLTWSRFAGDNIGVLRAHYGWSTPSVKTALSLAPMPAMNHDEHAGHHGQANTPTLAAAPLDPATFDQVLASARAAGIDAGKLEIRPARSADKAWTVSEIDRRWPTQVDAVSIDPTSLRVVDQVRFAQYSLPAKLTRWGIDAHMGVLFGLANQLVLVVIALGLLVMTVWGYLLWWRRRPTRDPAQPGLIELWRRLPPLARVLVPIVALALGLCLPVLGGSLLLFLLVDALLGLRGPALRTEAGSA